MHVSCVSYHMYLRTYLRMYVCCVGGCAVQGIRCSVVKQCTCLFSVECKQ